MSESIEALEMDPEIDAFLEGRLDEPALEAFELRLLDEPAFARSVEQHRIAREVLADVLGEAAEDSVRPPQAEVPSAPSWIDRFVDLISTPAWSGTATAVALVAVVAVGVQPISSVESTPDELSVIPQELVLEVMRGGTTEVAGQIRPNQPVLLFVDSLGHQDVDLILVGPDSKTRQVAAQSEEYDLIRVLVPGLAPGAWHLAVTSDGVEHHRYRFQVEDPTASTDQE